MDHLLRDGETEAKARAADGAKLQRANGAKAPSKDANKENKENRENKENKLPNKQVQEKQRDRERDHMRAWRRDWREIMASAHFYFDGVDPATVSRARSHLSLLGAVIEPFYQSSVTLVVTKRPLDVPYPANDLLSRALAEPNTRLWTLDKLRRFMTNLLSLPDNWLTVPTRAHIVPTSLVANGGATGAGAALASAGTAGLNANTTSDLLREERLTGSNRHYFKGPYLLVWDPTQHHRPFLHKEYKPVDDSYDGDWPQLRRTALNRCPFVLDPTVEDAFARRNQSRRKLQKIVDSSRLPHIAEDAVRPLAPISPNINTHTARPMADKGEVAASGLNRSTSAATRSMAMDSTGKEPPAQALNIKRKTAWMPRAVSGVNGENIVTAAANTTTATTTAVKLTTPAKKNQAKPGYCENCRDKFDDFDEHVRSKRHTRFALDDSNFRDLDAFLAGIGRKRLRTDR